MNKFSWYEARSIEDAVQQATATVAEAVYEAGAEASVFKSGGIDVWDLVKEGLLSPKRIVNVRNIPGLDEIQYDAKAGLSIGANVTLTAIGSDPMVGKHFGALQQAVVHAATPQLRNMSTLAGNLAQRTRCWYFRSKDHPCLRKGGSQCFARDRTGGENENHAILHNGSCVSLHSSSIATALLAFNASVVYQGTDGKEKIVPIEDFFVLPAADISTENILKPGDLITEIRVPTPDPSARSFYIKQGARESYDWSLADVAVVAKMSGDHCDEICIALGAAAPTPIRAYQAETLLAGGRINNAKAEEAATTAMEGARPLTMNGYKIPLFKSIIKTAILEMI